MDKLAAKVHGILLAQPEAAANGDSKGEDISGPQSEVSKPAAERHAKAQQAWKDALRPLSRHTTTVRWDKAFSSALESKVLSGLCAKKE